LPLHTVRLCHSVVCVSVLVMLHTVCAERYPTRFHVLGARPSCFVSLSLSLSFSLFHLPIVSSIFSSLSVSPFFVLLSPPFSSSPLLTSSSVKRRVTFIPAPWFELLPLPHPYLKTTPESPSGLHPDLNSTNNYLITPQHLS
jgi:hypothetical protein